MICSRSVQTCFDAPQTLSGDCQWSAMAMGLDSDFSCMRDHSNNGSLMPTTSLCQPLALTS